jgi:inner membrane protein
MDSLTHIAIGACIGDLFLGKKIGRKAMLYGALAASLPDVDFVASFWLGPADDLLAHRGFTHSFLFSILAVLVLAFLFGKRHHADGIPVSTWLLFMGTEIFIHLFLDGFNAYGVGWFEPFSHYRVSFNAIFVADPFFSLWPGIAAIVLLILKRNNSSRKKWAAWGLLLCSFYLIYCLFNKSRIDRAARLEMSYKGIRYNRYLTTPTPFNNWLWFIVAETDSGFHLGYRSVFDNFKRIDFQYFPRNEYMLRPFSSQSDVLKLIRFSQGYFTVDSSRSGIEFNDLRFGQIMGWQYPASPFVFHFYLQNPDSNRLVVQRGRFTNWNARTIRFFLKRIKGVSDR